jgi:hypothetical protein
MTKDELERRLRDWYRAEIAEREAAPEALHSSVGTIPETTPTAGARMRPGRGFVLLAAAALLLTLLIGATIAIGSGLLPAPWAVDETPPVTLAPVSLPRDGRLLEARPYWIWVSGDEADVPLRVTVTVPARWRSEVPDGSEGGMRRGHARLHVWIVDSVFTSLCPPTTLNSVGPTVDDLTSALASIERVEASTPTDIVVDGHRGKRIEITIPDDACVGALHPSYLWGDQDGGVHRRVERRDYLDLLIVDVVGTRLVIDAWSSIPGLSSARATIEAELRGIVESIQIEPFEAGS